MSNIADHNLQADNGDNMCILASVWESVPPDYLTCDRAFNLSILILFLALCCIIMLAITF
jgi:hypothetical protein